VPIPVVIPSGPLSITEAESLAGEQLLAAFAQLLAAGSAGSTTVTPFVPLPVYPNPGGGPPAVNPLVLDTEQKQTMYRHLCIALAHSVILKPQVSTTPTADFIPEAYGTGLLDPGWLPLATAALRGAIILSSTPAGTATALNAEEVTATPTASRVPRADGAGHINSSWLLQDIWSEVPSGAINSSNTVFTTANTFRSGTTRVFLNGLRQKPSTQYAESAGNTITFASAPTAGSSIIVDYSR